MPAPTPSSPFPTFLQYWKNLIQPSRRTVPILKQNTPSKGKKKNSNAKEAAYLEGALSISNNGSYCVDGHDFAVDAATMVFGDLKIGSQARVQCFIEGNRRRAVKITIA